MIKLRTSDVAILLMAIMWTVTLMTAIGRQQCLDDRSRADSYGDLCAERSTGYEEMSGEDAHYEGAKCMAEVVRSCMGLNNGGWTQ